VVSLTGLDRYFVAVIGLERVNNPKPHPEALEEGLRCLGLDQGEGLQCRGLVRWNSRDDS
ncbi:HAD hydrolase-like protein, partial [Acetomicrobium sp. S15 = DSM 107314]|uniref:HAD hydrolase-like protein n=1 Tax=Acetomicrobium sp. S15 = DSM 107314 TaxID=2529858 RepID=UPI0018E10748